VLVVALGIAVVAGSSNGDDQAISTAPDDQPPGTSGDGSDTSIPEVLDTSTESTSFLLPDGTQKDAPASNATSGPAPAPKPPVEVSDTTTSSSTTPDTSAGSTTTTTMPVVLNYSLPPVFGSSALTSGFVPDPFMVNVNVSNGPANASYLGGGCGGYTTSAPSFSVNYTSGAFPKLRFYAVTTGDSVLIINTPGGSYVCNDDSFGTVNPTLDFDSPSSGRYDVWIASKGPGGSVSGKLFATENSGNHP
jgi:hypothetical protein